MQKAEFDQFAKEYTKLHAASIEASGETLDFFAEYKVIDAAGVITKAFGQDPVEVLDFGSGVGNSIPFFSKHISNAKLTCVDISEESLRCAETRFPNLARYVPFDGKTLPFADETFNFVFTACVFHHIPADEHQALFREVFRVLKKKGIFVIFEHNPYNPLTVRAVNNCIFDKNAVLLYCSAVRQQLVRAGFHQVKGKYRIFFPGFLRVLRFFERFLTWLPLGAQYYVLGYK